MWKFFDKGRIKCSSMDILRFRRYINISPSFSATHLSSEFAIIFYLEHIQRPLVSISYQNAVKDSETGLPCGPRSVRHSRQFQKTWRHDLRWGKSSRKRFLRTTQKKIDCWHCDIRPATSITGLQANAIILMKESVYRYLVTWIFQ